MVVVVEDKREVASLARITDGIHTDRVRVGLLFPVSRIPARNARYRDTPTWHGQKSNAVPGAYPDLTSIFGLVYIGPPAFTPASVCAQSSIVGGFSQV